jgi:hypothetical protein
MYSDCGDFYSGTKVDVEAKDTPTHIFLGWALVDENDEICSDDTWEDYVISTSKTYSFIIKEDITIYITDDDSYTAEAKLDTGNGAKASTIGCDSITEDGEDINAVINGKEYKFKKHGMSRAKVGQGIEERVTVIIPRIKLGTRQLLDVEFALVDNRDKSTKILLNRDVLSKLAYLVNPGKKHILDEEK